MIARGPFHDLGSCLSLIFGVLSTQTYAQAIWSAKNNKAAKKGALLTAVLTPPIGIACTFIGLFMRTHYITTPEGLKELSSSSQVFPAFVIDYMPSLIGGFILGALLLAVIGGGAGLSLGVATILVKDILNKFIHYKDPDAVREVITTRITILFVLILAALMAIILPGTFINDFGFLSMGLRGTVVLIPLTCALFLKGKIHRHAILVSMILGPAAVLIGRFLPMPFDSLFLGIAVCLICCMAGRKKEAAVH